MRLTKEVEGKLEEGQMDFRRGKGTTDAIYILNHIINRKI